MKQVLDDTYTTTSAEETKQVAKSLVPSLEAGDVIVLKGDLGAGKTQFVQGLAAGLGITNPVTSPTFTLLASYEEGFFPLYHFDWYRLEDESELEDIAYYDVIDGPGIVCIEWPTKFTQALPDAYLEITITPTTPTARTIQMKGC